MEHLIHLNHEDSEGNSEIFVNPDNITFVHYAAAGDGKEAEMTILFNGSPQLKLEGDNAETLYSLLKPQKSNVKSRRVSKH